MESTAKDAKSCSVTFLATHGKRGGWLGALLTTHQLLISLFCASLMHPTSILHTLIVSQRLPLIHSLFTVLFFLFCNVHCNFLLCSFFGNIFAASSKESCSIAPLLCTEMLFTQLEKWQQAQSIYSISSYMKNKRSNFV